MNGWWRRKRGYFEGWYQKISSLEKTYTAVFIYGIAHHHNRKHGFVQWASTSHKGGYKEFPIETVTFNREKHLFESPDLVARKQFLKASLGELEVDLQFDYSNTIRKNSMVSNVMGPNQLVPFLPCYIAVEEPNTPVEGTLSSTNRSQKFIGISYTEKSWGHTFPKDYCWMHTTSPEEGIELLLAVADVPVSVWNHQTSIGYLKLDNTIISLARHKGARVEPGAAGQLIM